MSEYMYEILRIFQAYSKNLNDFVLYGVVWPFLLYEMVNHISEIFQASEWVHPKQLHSIHPSEHQTMLDPISFHPGWVWYIQPNTT
jgi:hypothetical protein